MTLSDFAESFEKSAIVDAAVAFCQTDDEKIERKCRLVNIALRNQQDGTTVECSIDRNRCMIRSMALYDISQTRIDNDEEDEAGGGKEEKGVKALEAISKNQKSALQKVQDEMGLGKKAEPVAKKSGLKKSFVKKGGLKNKPMPERLTKKVP